MCQCVSDCALDACEGVWKEGEGRPTPVYVVCQVGLPIGLGMRAWPSDMHASTVGRPLQQSRGQKEGCPANARWHSGSRGFLGV